MCMIEQVSDQNAWLKSAELLVNYISKTGLTTTIWFQIQAPFFYIYANQYKKFSTYYKSSNIITQYIGLNFTPSNPN